MTASPLLLLVSFENNASFLKAVRRVRLRNVWCEKDNLCGQDTEVNSDKP